MTDAYDLDGQAWRNRIEGFDMVPPDSLLANERNWRIHSKFQQDALAGLLDDVGWVGTVMVNMRTGDAWDDNSRGVPTLVDGHARVKLALRNDEPEIPAIFVDLSPAEEAEVLATYDPIAAMAAADAEMLDDVLHDVQTGDEAIQQMLAEMAEREGLVFGDNGYEEADAEPEIDRAEELREAWGVEPGQLWRLPSRTAGHEHRLICGDCTDADVVERVMGGEKANIVVTDPPWGVDYDGGTKVREKLANDEDAVIFDRFLPLIPFQDDTPIYCWFALGMSEPTFAAFRNHGWEIRSVIIWAKNHAQFGALSAHYKEKKEPLIYAFRRGKVPKWRGPNNEVTVWNADRKAANKLHPTEKPTELQERAIRNSSDHADIVYEPFAGSGTTIIAAENLGRQARAIEISPAYVAVALDRYERAFGVTPELVE